MSQEEIPKIIHYCWLGGKKIPAKASKCMKSWAKVLPEYELLLWNENNFDINCTPFTKEAYESKKYAFVTDYVRLFALYTVGGVYMDTDVEVLKPLDRFLKHSAFTSFEHPEFIPTGLMAAKKGDGWIKRILEYYEGRHFVNVDGKLALIPNTRIITDISENEFGLIKNNQYQVLPGDVHIYPQEYFCPMDWEKEKIVLTKNTHAIHHFSGSWVPKKEKVIYRLRRIKTNLGHVISSFLGKKNYEFIANNTFRKVRRGIMKT